MGEVKLNHEKGNVDSFLIGTRKMPAGAINFAYKVLPLLPFTPRIFDLSDFNDSAIMPGRGRMRRLEDISHT